ncbi:MAG: TolC family protein [Halarcobacter ebronensis]|uniref:TolC family protein n=1 Tax=Halarcobacter ebronensis TaxID=1462615 RepID=UPI003C707FDA
MKSTVVKSLIALSFVSSSLLAQVEIDPKTLVNDDKKLLKENKLNQKEGKKDSLDAISKDTLNTVTSITQKKSNKKLKGLDTSVYTKVKLIDAVLETIAQSEILKSSRENVIQYELKLKNAMAEYYPTVDFEYVRGRTRSKPGDDEDTKFKFFNDEYYKFVLRQNLYSGGSTNYMVKSVSKKLEVAKNQYKIKLDSEIKKAIKAYFDVVFANRSVMVNERNMKKLNKILEIVTIKYDNGAASIGDLTSIKANVANAMTKLVKVKSKFIESLRYYEYIVGTRFEKTLPFEKNFDIKIDEFDKLYERALENNKNLINYYKSIQSEKFKHKSIRGKFEPKVDFELSYKESMQGEEIEEEHEQDINGKVRVTYNLFNAGRDKNRVLEVNSAIRDLNYRLEEEKKKMKWNLSKIHTSITSVSDALKSTIEEVVASRKMVSSYWEAFKLGEQDLQALLQGQKQLNAAETEVVKFEKNQVNDFFSILEITGDLSAFFDVDPENPKFIDFSKSDYKKTVVAKDGQKISLDLGKKEEPKKEEVKEEKPIEVVIPELSLEEKIDNFVKEFYNFDDESYMVKIESFKNIYESFSFIKDKKIDNNSFSFDILDNLKIKNIVVHNNFKDEKLGKEYILKFKKDNSLDKEVSLIKVKEVKSLYKNYLAGLEIKKPKAQVKVVEKIRQEKQKEEFVTNELFKEKFFNSNDDFYTINISSFATKKELEDFVVANDIYENSFFFKYFSSVELYKLVLGIYPSYKDIENDINELALKNNGIFPIVEKIENIKVQFKENIDLNIEKVKSKEYEYISLKDLEVQKKKEAEKRKKEEELKSTILNKKEKARLKAEQKEKEEAQKLEEQRLLQEKLEQEELERQRIEQELLEKEQRLAKERKLVEEKAKLEAEQKAKIEAQKLEEQRLEKEKLEKEELERQRIEQELLEKEQRLVKERKLAEEKVRLEDEEKARLEAEEKAKEEAQKLEEQRLEKERLKQAELERQRIEQELLEKEQRLAKERKVAEEKARLEEQKAKIEAQKLEEQRLEKEKLEQEELERQRIEQELLEKEQRLAKQRKLVEEKAKLEAEQKAKEEQLKLEEIKDKTVFKNNIENSLPIEEIDLSGEKKEKREVIPYKKRIENFEEEFSKASSDKYTLHLATIKAEELAWYRKRFALEPSHFAKIEGKNAKIYFGIFDTKEKALEKVEYLHPKIFESNPRPKTIGSIR